MYTRRLIPFLGLFLLLSGGQSIQMVERADAVCCPTPRCGTWWWMIHGTAVVTNPTARITTAKLEKDGLSYEASVSQEVVALFKKEGILGKPVHGFAVFDGDMMMIAFIPNNRPHHEDKDKTMPPNQALKFYNEEFEKFVMGQGKSGKPGGSSMP